MKKLPDLNKELQTASTEIALEFGELLI